MAEFRDTTRGRNSERHRLGIGPVTAALRSLQAEHGERREIQVLRRAIRDRIEADLALLDRLDRGELGQ